MTGGRLNRNSVFFRFASEGHAVERIDFQGSQIAVGDLKQAIAEKKSLPKFDLVLVNDATNEVYTRDGAMVPKNLSVTVRRTPLQNSKKPAVLHVEGTDIWSAMVTQEAVKEEPPVPVRRSRCPPEYLCPLCSDIFRDPNIARCCGRSACLRCFEERRCDACPICSKPWTEETTPIRNPRLADSVASLDLEYFILPSEQCSRGDGDRGGDGDPHLPRRAEARGLEEAAAVAATTPEATPEAAGAAAGPPAAEMLPGQWGPPLLAPLPSTFVGPPPALPPGVTVRPCMLTPEQFHAWQQSLRGGSESSSSSSDGGAGTKLSRRSSKDVKKKHKKKSKKRKSMKSSSMVCSDGSSARKPRKSSKKRKK